MPTKRRTSSPVLPTGRVTFLFTDIEGSTRLWEQEPDRMSLALARHDALVRAAVESNRGMVVKMVGDGVHAVFDDPLDALNATLAMQEALGDASATNGVTLRVRCGLHAGTVERRDNDYFGSSVNRAARIMSAAHGGQVLLSQVVVDLVTGRLPLPAAVRDLGSVRLRDLATAERVYQLVHPRLREDFPALRSLETTPNNLPHQVAPIIGRERELAHVKQLLGATRLLTLLGAGGLGKTRLSLQLAADALDDYPDGVWFVELAPLADDRLVPQAVAVVLGVKEEARGSVREALVNHVKDRRLLIVLDNCEHLLAACAEIAKKILQAGAHVKILASSREHLHVAGETTYLVPPLSVPAADKTITPADLTQYEAVRLFIERAVAGQPAFQMTQQNATAVANICHRLDGIPLAIELAAARVRALSLEQIAAHLADRFLLLTRGDHTAPPRHQTLRASIDWSYDLLSQKERVLLRRLAVFAGGWTLDAAEALGAGGEIDKSEVLDLLTSLVEKSLVALEAEGERYRLLETVRQYALERLTESGEGDQALARHLAFFLAFAERTRPKLEGPEQAASLALLDRERENLFLAYGHTADASAAAELGLRLAYALTPYWINRGFLALAHRVAVEALERPGAHERSPARWRVLFDAGQLGCFMGRCGEAQGYLAESLAIAHEIGDRKMIVASLRLLGNASFGLGNRAEARAYLDESLALSRELGDQRELESTLNALAEFHRAQGDSLKAEPLYEEALALNRERGDSTEIAINLLNLAMVSIGHGSADRAREAALEAIAIVEEIGSKPLVQGVLEVSAGLGALCAEWERAALFFGAAEAQTGRTGLHRDPADEAFLSPLIARTQEAMDAAAFAAAEGAGRALSYEEAMTEAHTWLASARK
jgi:predicted ATPase/class 3 adenylate cyclase